MKKRSSIWFRLQLRTLNKKSIIDLHDAIGRLDMFGVRDEAFLEHVQYEIVPRIVHEDMNRVAAVLMCEIISKHGFFDGNKRTGLAVATVVLYHGGREIVAEPEEIERYCKDLARRFEDFKKGLISEDELPTYDEVEMWIRDNSGKILLREALFYFVAIWFALSVSILVIPMAILTGRAEGIVNRLRGV